MDDDGKYVFACSCGPEGRAEIKSVRKWAEELLETSDPLQIMTMIPYYLNWNYHASINGIYVDQWGAIEVTTEPYYDITSDHKPKSAKAHEPHNVMIQFDLLFDGFLYVLKNYHEKYGDKIDD